MLFRFILEAQKEGLRNVLIIHGKGREAKSHANIVRSYVARWLTEFEDVQAYCSALPHHGGGGHVMSRYVKRCRLNRITGSAMRSVVGKSLPLADRTASASSREPDFMPDITPYPNAQDSARERAITLSTVITRRNSHSLI